MECARVGNRSLPHLESPLLDQMHMDQMCRNIIPPRGRGGLRRRRGRLPGGGGGCSASASLELARGVGSESVRGESDQILRGDGDWEASRGRGRVRPLASVGYVVLGPTAWLRENDAAWVEVVGL
ncbi:hypothetical protein E2562_026702 [Oryza meyeriana var. granulata]|uniref:Uncharacterized protein n=1 Tax=Oryza meyeriana var. granulata TaxID=110450 RepID=A0A6G1E2D2_9ORYZ|nr:hypothetical protein E2562_026702 [Oryza meyeriana var. granulata]